MKYMWHVYVYYLPFGVNEPSLEPVVFLPQIPVLCRGIPVIQKEGLMTCKNIAGYLAVYRICFALAAFFFLFMLIMIKVQSSKDPRSKIQNGWDATLFLVIETSVVMFVLVTVQQWFLSAGDQIYTGDHFRWYMSLLTHDCVVYRSCMPGLHSVPDYDFEMLLYL